MKTYTVTNTVRHGDATHPLKDYAAGEAIELSDDHAAPLLAAGDIAAPVEPKGKK